MATRRQASHPALRIFDGWAVGRPSSPGDDGRPRILGRASGFPLEVRVWTRRPNVAEAIRHPSGVWIAIRQVGAALC